MKSVLMIILFLTGLAITNANAQSCCKTPPAGCCEKACKTDSKGSAAVMEPGTAVFASCSPEAMAACEGKKMSKKEMKECEAKCTPAPGCQAKGSAAIKPEDQKAPSTVKPSKG